ncbi:MAG TPA: four helix bundle protein [Opitutaceae bacterium]|nr:four helix bundle protein [Opitutaceae bacterium]HND61763.1 four helix bundle protein [Opitutaceae bacterium]
MSPEEFRNRTKQFSLRVIRVVESLPRDTVSRTLGNQLLRSGTSVAANYRAASRAKSPADFIAKMGIVEEETDESLFWMELLIDSNRIRPEPLFPLMKEGREILAMTVASITTSRRTQGGQRQAVPERISG